VADVTETRHGPALRSESRGVTGLCVVFSEGIRGAGLRGVPVTGRVRIGRDDDVELKLEDGQASRVHAEVEPADGGVLVTDLGSRNGTFVDGRRVSGSAVLAEVGALVRCGKTLLRVVADVTPYLALASEPPSLLVGGPRMAAIRRSVENVAPLAEPVLIEGETGTGKEKIAEALHAASRRKGEFVPVNCAAIPSELVEAELFGHAKGAFSGSERTRQGLFRAADAGTLLLDEIGDLPLAVQAKLLRVLEGGEVRPVGEDRPLTVDVRVVAATNLSLDEMVAEGRFRADLLHRVAAWRIRVPPLRDRSEDIPLFVDHFLPDRETSFTVEAMERLMGVSFPGNVRELRNLVRTAAARASADGSARIGLEHLPPGLGAAARDSVAPAAGGDVEDAVLRAKIETALALREGNVAQVARDLGFGRPWLYQTLKRLGIDPDSYRKR
jgi:transcriptional regulator with GAF, ATPase, and Fis domain